MDIYLTPLSFGHLPCNATGQAEGATGQEERSREVSPFDFNSVVKKCLILFEDIDDNSCLIGGTRAALESRFAGSGFGGCPQLRVGECRTFAAVNRSNSIDDFSLRIHGYGYGDDTGIVTVVVFGIWQ